MGTYSIYLNDEEKEKVQSVAQECNVKSSAPIKILVEYVPKWFLKELVQSHKERNEQ